MSIQYCTILYSIVQVPPSLLILHKIAAQGCSIATNLLPEATVLDESEECALGAELEAASHKSAAARVTSSVG